MKILAWPPFVNNESYTDFTYRAAWHLAPYSDVIDELAIVTEIAELELEARPAYIDRDVEEGLPSLQRKLRILQQDQLQDLMELCRADDVLFLLWSLAPESATGILKEISHKISPLIDEQRRRGRVIEVDPLRNRMEGSYFLWAGLNNFANKTKLIELSNLRFEKFLTHIKERYVSRNKAYVFGTGPTLSSFVESHDFSDGLCIIANSMVKNEFFLDKLMPVAIAAGDPIFHAGPSSYAGEFRRSLIGALEKTGAYFFCPLRDMSIYQGILPFHLQEKLIGLPFSRTRRPEASLVEDFSVQPHANVLTLLLLPLAATIAKEITVAGCDGRPLTQDSYFWSHDKSAQFNLQMDDIKHAHPAFFAIDYNDYYEEHCENTEKTIASIEKRGGRVVSATESFIPALSKRKADPQARESSLTYQKVAGVLCLDPDAKDAFGHFLSFDRRLAEAASAAGMRFMLAHRDDFDLDIGDISADHAMRVFSVHSWSLGNKGLSPNPSDLEKFGDECTNALKEADRFFERGNFVVYMYCGSLHSAQVLLDISIQYTNVYLNVNLFWSFNDAFSDPAYRANWASFFARYSTQSKLTMTVMTERTAKAIKGLFGVDLLVAAHPSTTFSDAEVSELASMSYKNRERPLSVLFPGGVTEEKGFALTTGAANELSENYHTTIRFTDLAARARKHTDTVKTLSGKGVNIVEGTLDAVQFKEFLDSGDILVLPYLPAGFRERTSGLLIDALYLGKPVVVLSETWLANIVEKYGFGMVASHDVSDIVRCVKEVADDFDQRSRAAKQATLDYFSKNSWMQLVEQIVDITEDEHKAMQSAELLIFPRELGAHVDETKVVSVLLHDRHGPDCLMLDVGAHYGTSAGYFEKLGWKIHCFEPDPANRTKLVAKFGKNERVIIHDKAVSDTPAIGVKFFSSEESTGISGLQAFRETHRVSATVDVTSIAAVADEFGITHVDFLKIDVEGFDFSVIRGVPWDRFSPDVIEAEFEDAKTIGLGYTYRDMCQYLLDRGYTVYVSEWHPIVRYGIRHQWCRVTKYPADLMTHDSWGNILAFKQDPGLEAIQGAFEECLAFTKQVEAPSSKAMNAQTAQVASAKSANGATLSETGVRSISSSGSAKEAAAALSPSQKAGKVHPAQLQAQRNQSHGNAPASQRRSPSMMSNEPLYTRIAMWAERRGGAIFALGQFAMHSLRLAKRQRALALAALVALVCLIGVAAWTTGLLQVLAFVGVAAVFIGAAVVAVVAYLSSQIHALNDNQRRELRRLQTSQSASLENLRKELRGLATTQDKARADLETSVVGLIQDAEARVMDYSAEQRASIEAVVATATDAAMRHWEERILKSANTESAQRQQLSKQLDENTKAIRSGLGANTNMYQRYGRVLSAQTADDLCKEWNQRLDTNFTRQQLAYLANRISSTEFSLNGRLATEVETQIVRTMSLLSIRKPSVRILEIGTLFGVAAACFYDASVGRYQSVDLTLLDPLDGYYGPGRGDVLTGELVNEIVLRRNLALAGVPNEAYTLVKALSTDTAAVEALRGQMFDFLLIDGDHTYQGVKNDFELYRSHVQPGGLILFDDYQTADWPDIAKYVDEEVRPRTDLVFLGASHRTAIFRAR